MKPTSSILKSPSEIRDCKIPVPASLQGENLKRRVSFGPQQIHEFSVESPYTQGTNSVNSAPDATPSSINQCASCDEESMELTDAASFNMIVDNFGNEQLTGARTGAAVHPISYGRDFPIQESPRRPLESWNMNRNNLLPSSNYSEVSMEFTCIDHLDDLPSKTTKSEQPNHLSQNPDDTPHMSWHNYSSTYFKNGDEIPGDPEPDCAASNISTPATPALSTGLHSSSTHLDFSDFSHADRLKYEKYLHHKACIAKLRPKNLELLQEIEVLKEKKSRMESEYSEKVKTVAAMKKELTFKNSELERKRAIIRKEVRDHLLALKAECLEVMNM